MDWGCLGEVHGPFKWHSLRALALQQIERAGCESSLPGAYLEVATSQLTSLSLSILFCKMDNHINLTGLF